MASKPKTAEEAPREETLKCQTWVLKVLIHCDGCTKRVKKILQGIDGVFTTEIDSRQHKVTVTGNVDAETLIKKLSRSGKSVELWPEKKPAAAEKKDNKKSGKSKGSGDINNKEEKEDKENSEQGGGSSEGGIIDDDGEEDSDKEGHGDDECDEGAGGGGESGKKKKKKKKKKNNKGAENGSGGSSAPPNNERGKEISSTVNAPVPEKLLISPPVQHVYPYPPRHMYYSPPPPPAAPYGLSYNTSYPISTSSSYYVDAPVMPMHAYNYAYSRLPPPPPPPSDPIKHYGHDEYEYEGGSYCSIM